MIHMKVIRLSNVKKVLAVAAIVFAAAVFIKCIPHTAYVQAFSQENVQIDGQSIYRTMMDKALPMLDAYGGNTSDRESSQFIAYTLFKYIIKADISNPRTYLTSQIPLLGIFNVPQEFTGNVAAKPGTPETKPEPPKTQPENSDNFDTQPVENPNLDYNKPSVVIFHTHTSESYTPTANFNYVDDGGYRRTPDKNLDVCRIGEEMKGYIEKYYGLAVIHDTTIHDLPSYNTSYKKSRVTAEGLVKKYPDAKLFIDMHRDAEVSKDKITIKIKDDEAAKIMFVIGKGNPHWQENYQLSQRLNQKIEELYPKLTRGIDVKTSLYNQDISNRMVLLEMGGDTNTLEESIISAKMVGKAIGQLIKEK